MSQQLPKEGRKMAQSHGSSSFVMPLEGSGSVARPFSCRAGAWWPTPAFDGWVATYVLICGLGIGECSGQQLPRGAPYGPKSWLLFFCDAIGGVWKCCSPFLCQGASRALTTKVGSKLYFPDRAFQGDTRTMCVRGHLKCSSR